MSTVNPNRMRRMPGPKCGDAAFGGEGENSERKSGRDRTIYGIKITKSS
jgi:hypothetical protein